MGWYRFCFWHKWRTLAEWNVPAGDSAAGRCGWHRYYSPMIIHMIMGFRRSIIATSCVCVCVCVRVRLLKLIYRRGVLFPLRNWRVARGTHRRQRRSTCLFVCVWGNGKLCATVFLPVYRDTKNFHEIAWTRSKRNEIEDKYGRGRGTPREPFRPLFLRYLLASR